MGKNQTPRLCRFLISPPYSLPHRALSWFLLDFLYQAHLLHALCVSCTSGILSISISLSRTCSYTPSCCYIFCSSDTKVGIYFRNASIMPLEQVGRTWPSLKSPQLSSAELINSSTALLIWTQQVSIFPVMCLIHLCVFPSQAFTVSNIWETQSYWIGQVNYFILVFFPY